LFTLLSDFYLNPQTESNQTSEASLDFMMI
jgi:hypothetical protein